MGARAGFRLAENVTVERRDARTGGSFCGNLTNCRKTENSLGAQQAKTHLSGTFLDRSAKNLLTVFSGRLTNLIDLPVFCLGQPLYVVAHKNKRQMGVTFLSRMLEGFIFEFFGQSAVVKN